MNYYTVPMIGTGTNDDPFRPDIPDGTPFAGKDSADGTYLIASPIALTGVKIQQQLPRQALEATANARGLTYDTVMKWNV